MRAVDEARALTHPQRAMRVLLECGHLRLMPWNATVMGIGAQTACGICPAPEGKPHIVRLVVDVAETGVLHESWAREGGQS